MQTVHVISLARSQERRSNFAARNSHLDYAFVDAVDGESMTQAQWRETGQFEPGLPYTAGAIGCALSHLRLWEQAIASNSPITVAEDDAVFRLDFHDMQARVMAQLHDYWDFISWGWNFDLAMELNLMPGVSPCLMVFDQRRLRLSLESFQHESRAPTPLPLQRAFGTPAYTLSPQGARRFRSLCFPLAHFELAYPQCRLPVPNNGIDVAMNRIYPLTASHACMPPLAVTPNARESSTVQTNRLLRT